MLTLAGAFAWGVTLEKRKAGSGKGSVEAGDAETGILQRSLGSSSMGGKVIWQGVGATLDFDILTPVSCRNSREAGQ